jgi:uncharacterized protein (TIGR02444 family)
MKNFDIDNEFWQFSVRIYSAKGVAAECLAIQDKLGVDVNVLLFSVWIGTKGIRLSQAQLMEIKTVVQDWNGMVVKPMRAVRRALKDRRLPEEAVRAFCSFLTAEELKAEQIEQAMLYAWSSTLRIVDREEPDLASVDANLALVLSSCGTPENQLSAQSLQIAARIYAD